MGVTERLARVCERHPWRVIAAWIVLAVVMLVATATLLGGRLTTEAQVTGNPESERAARVAGTAFPPDPRRLVSDFAIVGSRAYSVESRRFRAFVERLARAANATRAVSGARTYYGSHDPALLSADRHTTVIPFFIEDADHAGKVIDAVQRVDRADPAFTVALTGDRTGDHDFNVLSQDDLKAGELQFGLPAALIVLVLVFGAVVAGLVPILMAIVSIVVALGLVALVAQIWELSVFVINMLTGMGLALGIDYSLFVISRYREERARGRDQLDAVAMAGATASRAVLFSGTAFVVAMFGLLLVPTTIMRSLAAGAILVGIVSVGAALTLLPAVLGLIGDRVNALRVPVVGRSFARGDPEGRFWRVIIDRVLRRPVLPLALSAAALVAAATPVFGMHIGASGVTTLPDRFVSKQGFVLLQREFPRLTADPVRIVVAQNASSPPVARALARLHARLAADPDFGPGSLQVSPNGQVALVAVPVRGDPAGPRATAAVRRLRAHMIPELLGGLDTAVYVGGKTAENVDYFDAVTKPAPLVFTFVLGLTLILLTVVFRSLVIAAKAVLLNLLSVGAAYGLLVLVFQHGFASGLFGFTRAPTIEAWVPLFLFAVLFGLSMDYQVFLLSRIKEAYDASGDTSEAVAHGVASTARIITGAALIIVVVFIGFARGDLIMFQQMGFGVAVALLLDATVIRSVVLPSAMKLLGRWNWYLPRWLSWLPRLDVEGKPRPAPVS